MMTPSPSPDELIIQQRGRRKIPVTFSPDIDAIKQVPSFIRYILFLINYQHFTLFLYGFFLYYHYLLLNLTMEYGFMFQL